VPTVRPATEADFPALSRLDLTYPADRYLAIERSGPAPQHTFELRWREHDAPDQTYNTYTEDWLRDALSRAGLFLAAEVDGAPVGLLIVLAPPWTDAAEITDLAVGRRNRGSGAGSALVQAASAWARERGLRALWAEPHADNATAIEFYLRLGFRVSGFNDRLYSSDPAAAVVYMHLEL
jgi:ribosomal protein S18 acetylase RimI-like enzyme